MEVQLLSPEEFERFNKRMAELYGTLDTVGPYFRLVWSPDMYEKRIMTHTDEGFPLLIPEVREVPKYFGYCADRYILEGLQFIPYNVETDIPGRISYEPIWTFQDKNGDYLIPIWAAIRMILEQLKENQEGKGVIKYRDPESTPEEAKEFKEQRLEKLQNDLFGDNSKISTALSHRSGVAYGPGSSPNSSLRERES